MRPLHAGRRAGRAGQLLGAGAGDQKHPLLLAHDFLHGQRGGRAAAVREGLHAVPVEPLTGDRGRHIGLVLMIGLQDLNRLAVDRAAELLGRHPRRLDRAWPHRRREHAAHVGQDADTDRVALDLGMRGRRSQEDREDCGQPERCPTDGIAHERLLLASLFDRGRLLERRHSLAMTASSQGQFGMLTGARTPRAAAESRISRRRARCSGSM